jgi:hypothetical protein
MRPIASGMLVVPFENELQKEAIPGKKYPAATPDAITRKIHSVKNLSTIESFLIIPDIIILHKINIPGTSIHLNADDTYT